MAFRRSFLRAKQVHKQVYDLSKPLNVDTGPDVPTQHRYSLALNTFFAVPDQGDKELSPLCQGSCFFVKANPSEKFKHKYHLVTCSHIVAPWKFHPKMYPNDFLKFVSEKHTTYEVRMNHPDGTWQTSVMVINKVFHHPTKDLCVMHLRDEPETVKFLDLVDVSFEMSLSDHERGTLQPGQPVEYHGMQLGSMPFDEKKGYQMLPSVESGAVVSNTASRVLADTSDLLTAAMCGGPVLFPFMEGLGGGFHNGERTNRHGKAVVAGMFEGMEAGTRPDRKASIIESQDIKEFLLRVESGAIRPVVGGDIERFIGLSGLGEKLDIKDYFTERTDVK